MCIVGVHPDNTKKTHDAKAITQRVAALRPLALKPQTVAIAAGIDLTRDISTHFPQERLLQALLELAASVVLPVVLTANGGSSMVDRIVQNVRDFGIQKLALIHFGGTPADLQRARSDLGDAGAEAEAEADDAPPVLEASTSLAASGVAEDEQAEDDNDAAAATTEVYYMVTGALCDPTELGVAEKELVKVVPLHRLLLASDSPHYTPQTIPDPWIRENRNEPSNLSYVLSELVTALEGGSTNRCIQATTVSLTEAELAARLHQNALRFFGLSVATAEALAAAAERERERERQEKEAREKAEREAIAADKKSSKDKSSSSTAAAADDLDDDGFSEKGKGKGKGSRGGKGGNNKKDKDAALSEKERDDKDAEKKSRVTLVQERKPVPKPQKREPAPVPVLATPEPEPEPESEPEPVAVAPPAPVVATPPALVQYACKRCRFVLHTGADQVPHHRLLCM